MKKTVKRLTATLIAMAIIFTAILPQTKAGAAAKAPTLKVKGLTALFGSSSATITVKKNGADKIVKTTWSVDSAGKSAIKLSKKTNTSVKVTAQNTNGKATVTAKVKYTMGSDTKTVTLKQKFTSDTNGGDSGDDISYAIYVDSPAWVGQLPAAANATKLVVVAAFKDDATDAWFSYHEKNDDGSWHMVLTTPAFIGKGGVGKTKEGDNKTPNGTFKFNRAFGIADDPGCAIPYKKVTDDDWWSGDPNYHYNELVDIKNYPNLAKDDSEHIIDYTYHYQYCLNISYNDAGTPGLGSAIFLHCLGPIKPFTGGCVAIPEGYMKEFMTYVDADTVIVIDTAKNLFNDEWPSSTWPTNPNG